MTKKEREEILEKINSLVLKGIIVGVVSPIIGLIIGAIGFLALAPDKLEAHEKRLCTIETEIKVLRTDMNKNQQEILDTLRRDYNVKR